VWGPSALRAQEKPTVNATARELGTGRNAAGEVRVNDKVAFRIREGAGGLTAVQRADRVASRLNELAVAGRLQAEELNVRPVGGDAAIFSGRELVITADRKHARANGTTPVRLAEAWRDNLSRAMIGRVASYRMDSVRLAQNSGVEPELKTKLVPILTIGSSGAIGIAQVTGPEDRVRDVKAVAQLATDYKDNARIRMLVPIHTENIVQNLKRVPQVAVTGIGDIRF
jgi:hypothetical protein